MFTDTNNNNTLDTDLLSVKVQVINPGMSNISPYCIKSLHEIFKGQDPFSNTDKSTPSLPVSSLIRQLYGLQNELLEFQYNDRYETRYYGYQISDSDISLPYNIYSILHNIPVYIVGEDELGKPHKVHNIFTQTEETVDVPTADMFNERGLGDYLGIYMPDAGRIYIRIEKIIEESSKKNKVGDIIIHRDLLYQKVLLHEFIHLLFDVLSRNLGTTKTINKDDKILNEETFDNYLVLMCYANSTCQIGSPSTAFKHVRRFIKLQPNPYRDSISVYDLNTSWYTGRNIIRNLLIYKSKIKQK